MRAALALALAVVAGVAPRALAEPADPRGPADATLELRIGDDRFRLGGRVVTPDGLWGFWLDGARREQGLALQGRVQRDGRGLNFSLDTGPGARGTLRWWQDPL